MKGMSVAALGPEARDSTSLSVGFLKNRLADSSTLTDTHHHVSSSQLRNEMEWDYPMGVYFGQAWYH